MTFQLNCCVCLAIYTALIGNAHADRIFLKSGEILQGKLKDQGSNSAIEGWCQGKEHVILWENQSSRCVLRADIVKVEKEFRKPTGIALLAKKSSWGSEKFGYETQLIPLSEEFIIGKPMNFGLVLRNVSKSLKWYDAQAIGHNSLRVIGPDGKHLHYKNYSFQTMGSELPIDKEETVSLFDSRDISKEYVLTNVGKHRIQFREGDYGMGHDSDFPASNEIEFEVKTGTPSQLDVLISSMLTLLPSSNWTVTVRGRNEGPIGRQLMETIGCDFVRPSRLKSDVIQISLWQTQRPTELLKQSEKKPGESSEFLGRNSSGYFYILMPSRAEKTWPNIRKDILKKLELKGE